MWEDDEEEGGASRKAWHGTARARARANELMVTGRQAGNNKKGVRLPLPLLLYLRLLVLLSERKSSGYSDITGLLDLIAVWTVEMEA
ncbi:hypothetical protein AXG93_2841s1130 [Marchantia polymorpha subsp. ruderalis]|uniref:Uncharacterized protein n=1 Tax=Marchantia polymorpha subsp. ruderalis TaxID=1480154 RepID=A0A176WR41_MARPO|nr:hypothetical protein AXG93_2841s1130 [Marchantia polymorpha subsp. ruderalis]